MGTNTTSSYLDPPELRGVKNADGTFTLAELELKKLNDFNRKVSKMIQGGLNLANLNKETNEVFTGKVSFIDLSTGGSTIINGDNIKTGTITGIKIVSDNDGQIVQLGNGTLTFKNGTTVLGEITPDLLGMYLAAGTDKWIYLDGNVQVGLYDTVGVNGSTILIQADTTLKLVAGTNMAIDSSGTIYIGTSYGQSGNVTIGQTGGRVDLNGDVYKNGVLL